MRIATMPWSSIEGLELLPKRYLCTLGFSTEWRLGDLVDIASGEYVSEYCVLNTPGALKYIRVDNVRQFLPNLSEPDLVYIAPNTITHGDRVIVRSGDVVLSRTGTLGRAFVVDSETHGSVMSQHVTRLRPRPEAIWLHPYLLAAYLNSREARERVNALASGSTRLELTHEDLAGIGIPTTLKELATRTFLKEFDKIPPLFCNMRKLARAAIERCSDLLPGSTASGYQGLSCFSAEVRLEGRKTLLPRYYLPSLTAVEDELQTRFECKPLGEIAEVVRGAGTTSKEYTDSGIPYLMTSSLINYGIEFFPEHYATEHTYRSHGQNVGEGDIILTMEGKIGEVALLGADERCAVKNHIEIVRIRADADVAKEFVYAFLASPLGRAQLERRTVVQATIPGLGSASREVLIPIRSRRSVPDLERIIPEVCHNVSQFTRMRIGIRRLLHKLQQSVAAGILRASL